MSNPRIVIKQIDEGYIWEFVDEEDRNLARSSLTYVDRGRCEGHAWRVIEACRNPHIMVEPSEPRA
jgi:hypothetical protein